MTAGFRILPAPPRPSRELVAALAEMVTAHLSDNMSRLQGAAAAIRPMHAGARLAGPALTVRVPAGDNLMVHKAIDIAAPGDVIVVDAAGMLEQAIIGDIMTSLAAKRGVAGFVIDGAIRDLGEDLTRDLWFAAEREFWMRRNRTARVQKARQDRLGLGWANHDHHTYRSSRKNFKRLIATWEKLGLQCGIQDQLCSAYGGINFIQMHAFPHASVSPVLVPNSIWWELEQRLAVVYIGTPHSSN